MVHDPASVQATTAFIDALAALAPALQADAERYRPDDVDDAAGWRLAMGACAKMQATLAAGAAEGDVEGRLGELLAICPSRVSIDVLVDAAGTVERALLDELAPDPDIGTTSAAWPFVAQRVRRGTLTLLARFTAALNTSPELLYDPRTTLLSRGVLEIVLPQEIARAERHGRPFSLLLISIDQLHALDDRLGSGTSERVLERVGILTRRYFRLHDWLARFDNESICAVLPDTDPDAAASLAERFRVSVRDRLVLEDHRDGERLPVTLTIAAIVAEVMPAGIGSEDVLRAATQTRNRAQMDGGDRTERAALKTEEVSIPRAAATLGTGTLAIRRLLREGRLPSTRRGRHTYISLAALERLLGN